MRVEGWEGLLQAYLEAEAPFQWGERDCALWAADWVHLATGVDFGTPWRGQYKTEAGAAKLMRRRGYARPGDIADAHLEPCPVRLARRGDLLLSLDLSPQGCLGICSGRLGHFITAHGLTSTATLACIQAWRVG